MRPTRALRFAAVGGAIFGAAFAITYLARAHIAARSSDGLTPLDVRVSQVPRGTIAFEELLMVYVGAASCSWSNVPEMQQMLRDVKSSLISQARANGWRFHAVGIAIDWDVEAGLAHLHRGSVHATNCGPAPARPFTRLRIRVLHAVCRRGGHRDTPLRCDRTEAMGPEWGTGPVTGRASGSRGPSTRLGTRRKNRTYDPTIPSGGTMSSLTKRLGFGVGFVGLAGTGVVLALALAPEPASGQTCSMKACNTDTNRCESVDLDYKCSNLPKWGCTFSQPC
jgi:hypothetical protein